MAESAPRRLTLGGTLCGTQPWASPANILAGTATAAAAGPDVSGANGVAFPASPETSCPLPLWPSGEVPTPRTVAVGTPPHPSSGMQRQRSSSAFEALLTVAQLEEGRQLTATGSQRHTRRRLSWGQPALRQRQQQRRQRQQCSTPAKRRSNRLAGLPAADGCAGAAAGRTGNFKLRRCVAGADSQMVLLNTPMPIAVRRFPSDASIYIANQQGPLLHLALDLQQCSMLDSCIAALQHGPSLPPSPSVSEAGAVLAAHLARAFAQTLTNQDQSEIAAARCFLAQF